MKENRGQVEVSASQQASFVEHRETLARIYRELPVYGSEDFWTLLETSQAAEQALPLEIVVRVLRENAIACGDQQSRRRLCEIIIARLQSSNEQWVGQALSGLHPPAGERSILAADLYADLCELLLRALFNLEAHFWQERFYHCLRLLRKHAYESFLRKEGRWRKATPGPGKRVPYALLESIDRVEWSADVVSARDVLDERAERDLLAVEQTDFAALLYRLPTRQRAVVWLIFWEDYTIKAISELLNITERTVSNRLAAALAKLRRVLEEEQEVRDGASA
ncbi:MAG TPA: sigma factor-like helix-turn-helix DNA-binding protein [Ktedonobacteraceae bacterium]